MKQMIEFNTVVPVHELHGDNPEDTGLLNGMLQEAKDFIFSYDWCHDIVESYFGLGIGGIVAVFLFKILSARLDSESWIWVVVGDLPSAYLVGGRSPNPACTLRWYVKQARIWATSGQNEVDGTSGIHIFMEPTPHFTDMLRTRMDFIENEVLVHYATQLSKGA